METAMTDDPKPLEELSPSTRRRREDERLRKKYRPLVKAICRVCATWNLAFCEQKQARLPFELRNMVYKHVWDTPTLQSTQGSMAYLVHRRCRGARKGKEEECQKVASAYEPGTEYTCYLHPCYMHTWTPFFVRPGYVGQETAREVVEAWYKIFGDLIELQHIIRRDVFFVGLDPSKFLRTLTLDLHVESLFTSRDGESTQECIDSLLSIKRKTDFKLIIQLRQRNISFNSWSTAFDALRHVVTVFEGEGAHVEATFTYDKESLCPKITWDLLPALKSGNDDWRAEAERYLNSDSRLRSRHKVYHQASNVADVEHSDESEYDPNDDVEPEKDNLRDNSDFNMNSFINALPHLGRGDPFYGTYLEPHDFKPPPPPKIRRPAWEEHLLWNE